MQLQLHVQPYMRQQFRPGSHGLNMFNFVQSNVQLSVCLCFFSDINISQGSVAMRLGVVG